MMSFMDSALTRSEMKNVIGGACRVCSTPKDPSLGGTCGTYTLTADEARQYAADGNASNDGYVYSHDCE